MKRIMLNFYMNFSNKLRIKNVIKTLWDNHVTRTRKERLKNPEKKTRKEREREKKTRKTIEEMG